MKKIKLNLRKYTLILTVVCIFVAPGMLRCSGEIDPPGSTIHNLIDFS